ncbi:MAG: hypothetical protein ACP5QG_09790 [candidate division WOR-3 bacterium]
MMRFPDGDRGQAGIFQGLPLEIRPMYRWTDRRIEAHVFLLSPYLSMTYEK